MSAPQRQSEKENGGYVFRKRCAFSLHLKEESEVVTRTSSGRSFQIIGASKLKLLPNCFGDIWDVQIIPDYRGIKAEAVTKLFW